MYQPSTQLNWPAELQALAEDPEAEAVVAAFQRRVPEQRDPRPAVSTQLVRSSGLVSRTGARLPVSASYEHTVTTIPAIRLLKKHPDVAAAFGQCLAGPESRQAAFLLACVEKAGLAEQYATLLAMPPEHRSDAVYALYGHVNLESGIPLVIALPLL